MICSITGWMLAALLWSQGRVKTSTCMCSRCSLACASSSALRAVRASLAPISPRASAICNPRPREPPVTSATLPVRSISFFTLIGKFSLVHFGSAAWSCRRDRLKPLVAHLEQFVPDELPGRSGRESWIAWTARQPDCAALFDDRDYFALADNLAFLEVDLDHGARARGGHRDFHFHRLEDEHGIVLRHLGAGSSFDFPNLAGDVADYFRAWHVRPVLLGRLTELPLGGRFRGARGDVS